jgi:hypothetical protein
VVRLAALGALAALAVLAGCGELSPYRCVDDAQCAGGACTSDGFCAFEDPFCPSGLSYDASAGELAGACVATSPTGDTAERPRTLESFQMLDVADARDDNTPSCAASGHGRDVYFQTTIEEVSRLYLDTLGSDFRVVLSVHRGTCAARTSQLTCGTGSCNDRLHQWSEIVEPGTYCVIADRLDDADPGTTLVVRSFTGDPAPLGRLGLNVANTCDEDRWFGSCSLPDAPDATWFVMSCVPATISVSTCTTAPGFYGDLQAYTLSETERACRLSCSAEIRLAEAGAAWIVAEDPDYGSCGPLQVEITAR